MIHLALMIRAIKLIPQEPYIIVYPRNTN